MTLDKKIEQLRGTQERAKAHATQDFDETEVEVLKAIPAALV